MAAKLTRLNQKIAIQLHLVAEISTISSSRSGNFWIHPRINIFASVCTRNQVGNIL